MDIKISIILIALINFALGGLLFFKSKKTLSSVAFAFVSISFAVWSLALYFYEHPILMSSFIWIKIVYSIVLLAFIPSYFYFALVFPQPPKKKRQIIIPLISYSLPALCLLYILWFSNLWVQDVIITSGGVETILGPAYLFFIIFASFFGFAWFIAILLKKYFKATGILKMQLRYIFIGLFLCLIFVIILDGILPLLAKNTKYFWLSTFGSLFSVVATIYAITRYRLMDVRLIIKKVGVFSLALSVVVFLTISSVWFIGYLLHYTPNPILMIGGAFAVAVSVIVFIPLRSFLQNTADKILFKQITSAQEALKELSRYVLTVIDFDKLINTITQVIGKALWLNKIAIIIKEPKSSSFKPVKIVGFNKEKLKSLKYNFLTKYFKNNKAPLVFEELKDLKAQKQMSSLKALICMPLISKNTLQGIILLGKKISSEVYTKEDLDLLEALTAQTSIAIENSRLYDQIRDLSDNLQTQVNKQTNLIQNQLDQIKILSRAREDFIEIASHQLRTPISGAASFMSSFVDGTLDNESKEARKADYKLIYKSMHKLQDVVNQLLDALAVQKIQGLKLVNKKLYEINEEMENILQAKTSTLKIEAEEKQINFQISRFPKNLAPIWVDKYYFNSALKSLIDNALKYTPIENKKKIINIFLAVEQTVKIKEELEKNEIIKQDQVLAKRILDSLSIIPEYEKIFFCFIQDYGIGMTEEEQEQIIKFQPFQRSEKARLTHTDGTGLSLYLANNIIQAHQGKLSLYSRGEGKGAMVWFWVGTE